VIFVTVHLIKDKWPSNMDPNIQQYRMPTPKEEIVDEAIRMSARRKRRSGGTGCDAGLAVDMHKIRQDRRHEVCIASRPYEALPAGIKESRDTRRDNKGIQPSSAYQHRTCPKLGLESRDLKVVFKIEGWMEPSKLKDKLQEKFPKGIDLLEIRVQ